MKMIRIKSAATCIWLALLSIDYVAATSLSPVLQHTADTFFSDHSVRIVDGTLIHVHKVCLQGGRDGFVVPDLDEAKRVLRKVGFGLLPNATSPSTLRQFTRNETGTLFGENKTGPVKVWGPTYLMNCWRQAPTRTNPAHWLMKVNKMFYAAERQRDLGAANITSAMLLPQFENLAFHQCPSIKGMLSETSGWPWGKHLFLAGTAHWTGARLWKSLSSTNLVELHFGERGWTCFEDVYFDVDGSLSPGRKYQRRWLDALRKEMLDGSDSAVTSLQRTPQTGGHTLEAWTSLRSFLRPSRQASLRVSKLPALLRIRDRVRARALFPRKQHDAQAVAASLIDRCAHGAVRIAVFQRTEGTALRRFRNLADVLTMLSNHTSHPVEVVTVTSRTPVQDQSRLFADGFDMLVTPQGSHLANFVLCDPDKTAMVEVVPAIVDTFFVVNARQMGFRSYIQSTGHRALCDACEKYVNERCDLEEETGLKKCAEHFVRRTLQQSDMDVDINVLKRDMGRGLKALCNMTM